MSLLRLQFLFPAIIVVIAAFPVASALPDCEGPGGNGAVSACDWNPGGRDDFGKTGVYALGLAIVEGGRFGNETWISAAHYGVVWQERTHEDGSRDAHIRILPTVGLVNNPVVGDIWIEPVVVWSSHTTADDNVTCTFGGVSTPCPTGVPSNRDPALRWGKMLP